MGRGHRGVGALALLAVLAIPVLAAGGGPAPVGQRTVPTSAVPTNVSSGVAAGYVVRSAASSFTFAQASWSIPRFHWVRPYWFVDMWVGLGGYNASAANHPTAPTFGPGVVRAGVYVAGCLPTCPGVTVTVYALDNGRFLFRNTSVATAADNLTATIRYDPSNGTVNAHISDISRAVTVGAVATWLGAHLTSAEWVVSECQTGCGFPLAWFSSVRFHGAAAAVGGTSLPVGSWGTPIRLSLSDAGASPTVDALASQLSPSGGVFTVAWKSG